jgi:hypothetical protein
MGRKESKSPAQTKARKAPAKRKAAASKDVPSDLELVQARADFVRFLIEQDFQDARGAYRKAYPKANLSTAGVEACRLLKDPKVQEAIAVELKAVLDDKRLPLEKRILDTWVVRAFYDPTEILDLKGNLKITEAALRKRGLHVCIDSINRKLNAQGLSYLEYKLANRDTALDMLQRYIAMIKTPDQKPLEVNLSIGLPPKPSDLPPEGGQDA